MVGTSAAEGRASLAAIVLLERVGEALLNRAKVALQRLHGREEHLLRVAAADRLHLHLDPVLQRVRRLVAREQDARVAKELPAPGEERTRVRSEWWGDSHAEEVAERVVLAHDDEGAGVRDLRVGRAAHPASGRERGTVGGVRTRETRS